MTDSRAEFEEWYVGCTILKDEGLGSRACALQWAAWQASRIAAIEGLSLTDAEIDSIMAKAHGGKAYPHFKLMRRAEASAIIAALKRKVTP